MGAGRIPRSWQFCPRTAMHSAQRQHRTTTEPKLMASHSGVVVTPKMSSAPALEETPDCCTTVVVVVVAVLVVTLLLDFVWVATAVVASMATKLDTTSVFTILEPTPAVDSSVLNRLCNSEVSRFSLCATLLALTTCEVATATLNWIAHVFASCLPEFVFDSRREHDAATVTALSVMLNATANVFFMATSMCVLFTQAPTRLMAPLSLTRQARPVVAVPKATNLESHEATQAPAVLKYLELPQRVQRMVLVFARAHVMQSTEHEAAIVVRLAFVVLVSVLLTRVIVVVVVVVVVVFVVVIVVVEND